MFYIQVDDMDAARKKIESLGGRTINHLRKCPMVPRLRTSSDL